MILALTLAAHAESLDLAYAEALTRAGEHATGVVQAEAGRRAAEGLLLSARAPFEPTLTLGGSTFSSTDEGQFQFGAYTSETTGLSTSTSLAQTLATGTRLSLDFSADQSDTTFRIKELEQEFGSPAWQSKLALGLSQSLLQGDRLAYNLRGVHDAESALTLAELQAESARQDAVAAAARAYWALHTARRLVEIAEQSRSATVEQARITHALVDAGRLAKVEATRIEAALAQSERAVLDAQAAAGAAEDELATAVGVPLGTHLTLISSPAPPPALDMGDEAIVAAVLAGNPGLRIVRQSAADRARALTDARHALLPQLDATGSVGLRGYDTEFGASMSELTAGKLPEWSVGAQLTLPILNRADRGGVASAAGELERAKAEVVATEQTVAAAARAQLRTLTGAKQSLEYAVLNVRLAEETLAAERARLAEGKSLQRDVIAAQKDADQARADAEKARTDWLIAVVELQRLRGGL